MHNTSEGHKKIAEAIAAMWTQALGVTINIENQEWGVYLNTISKDTPVEERCRMSGAWAGVLTTRMPTTG